MGIDNFGAFLREYCPAACAPNGRRGFRGAGYVFADVLARVHAMAAAVHARAMAAADRRVAAEERKAGMPEADIDREGANAVAVDDAADAALEENSYPEITTICDAVFEEYARFFAASDAAGAEGAGGGDGDGGAECPRVEPQLAVLVTDNHRAVTPLKREVQMARAAAWSAGKDRRGRPRAPYDKATSRFVHAAGPGGRYEPLFVADGAAPSPRVNAERLLHSGRDLRDQFYRAMLLHAVYNVPWPARTCLVLQFDETPVVVLGAEWRAGKHPALVALIERLVDKDPAATRHLVIGDARAAAEAPDEGDAPALLECKALVREFYRPHLLRSPYEIGEGELIALRWGELLRVALHGTGAAAPVLYDTIDTDMFLIMLQREMRSGVGGGPRVQWPSFWADSRLGLWSTAKAADELRRAGFSWHSLVSLAVLSGCDTFAKKKATENIGHATIYAAMARCKLRLDEAPMSTEHEYFHYVLRCVYAQFFEMWGATGVPPEYVALHGKKRQRVAMSPARVPDAPVAERFLRAFRYFITIGESELGAPPL